MYIFLHVFKLSMHFQIITILIIWHNSYRLIQKKNQNFPKPYIIITCVVKKYKFPSLINFCKYAGKFPTLYSFVLIIMMYYKDI